MYPVSSALVIPLPVVGVVRLSFISSWLDVWLSSLRRACHPSKVWFVSPVSRVFDVTRSKYLVFVVASMGPAPSSVLPISVIRAYRPPRLVLHTSLPIFSALLAGCFASSWHIAGSPFVYVLELGYRSFCRTRHSSWLEETYDADCRLLSWLNADHIKCPICKTLQYPIPNSAIN